MKKVYKSALGRIVDIDNLRLSNEEAIAVGNMRVNARGDELGPGGEVVRSRNEVMSDYYKLNTPTVGTTEKTTVDEMAVYQRIQNAQAQRPTPVRGNLASTVLRDNQKILDDPEGEK
jgi:hypothetical protein